MFVKKIFKIFIVISLNFTLMNWGAYKAEIKPNEPVR